MQSESGRQPGSVLVAPDSFKGTFTAAEVAQALACGLRSSTRFAVDVCPVADGGEGTLAVLASAWGAQRRLVTVSDPLGRRVQTCFALVGDVAIVETAAASGLHLVSATERDAVAASTSGTGALIVAARRAGARTIYLGVGGSATTDGGAGAVAVIERAGGLKGSRLLVLCDVRTPFEHAASVFGPQKGARPQDIEFLTRRLELLARSYPRDPRGVPMTGAAGGLAGGLWAAFGAELIGGAASVLDAVGFDRRVDGAAAVITGEGRLDDQSREGKVISEVAARAGRAGVACYAVVGSSAINARSAEAMGLAQVLEASNRAQIERAGRDLGLVIGRRALDRGALESRPVQALGELC